MWENWGENPAEQRRWMGPTTTHHSRPVGASASTEQKTSIKACPSGLLARKSRPYADAPMSRERRQEIDVIKGMLTRYTRYDNMLLTCDDAAEGQHKLSLLTSLLWHTAIRVGGEIALQRARHQLKKLTHLGLTGKEKYRSLCIRPLREGGLVDITIMIIMCMKWCLMYSVYMLFTLDVTQCSEVFGWYCGRSLGTRLLYTQCHREVKGYKHFYCMVDSLHWGWCVCSPRVGRPSTAVCNRQPP